MYELSKDICSILEDSLGLPFEDLLSMNADDEKTWIENRINKELIFSKKRRHGIIGRGNPLLSRRKIRTKEDLERLSKKLYGV